MKKSPTHAYWMKTWWMPLKDFSGEWMTIQIVANMNCLDVVGVQEA
jgi:hypothetical protein